MSAHARRAVMLLAVVSVCGCSRKAASPPAPPREAPAPASTEVASPTRDASVQEPPLDLAAGARLAAAWADVAARYFDKDGKPLSCTEAAARLADGRTARTALRSAASPDAERAVEMDATLKERVRVSTEAVATTSMRCARDPKFLAARKALQGGEPR